MYLKFFDVERVIMWLHSFCTTQLFKQVFENLKYKRYTAEVTEISVLTAIPASAMEGAKIKEMSSSCLFACMSESHGMDL